MRRYGVDQSDGDGPEVEYIAGNTVKTGTYKSTGKAASRNSMSPDKMSRDLARDEWARSGFFDKPKLSLEQQIVVENEVQDKVQAEQERFFQSFRQIEEESQQLAYINQELTKETGRL